MVRNKKLKWGVFTSPQSGDNTFEQYIIENDEDLNKFAEAFPNVKKLGQYTSFKNGIDRGNVILADDPHFLHGHTTYRYESPLDSTHPSSFHRVSLGAIKIK